MRWFTEQHALELDGPPSVQSIANLVMQVRSSFATASWQLLPHRVAARGWRTLSCFARARLVLKTIHAQGNAVNAVAPCHMPHHCCTT